MSRLPSYFKALKNYINLIDNPPASIRKLITNYHLPIFLARIVLIVYGANYNDAILTLINIIFLVFMIIDDLIRKLSFFSQILPRLQPHLSKLSPLLTNFSLLLSLYFLNSSPSLSHSQSFLQGFLSFLIVFLLFHQHYLPSLLLSFIFSFPSPQQRYSIAFYAF